MNFQSGSGKKMTDQLTGMENAMKYGTSEIMKLRNYCNLLYNFDSGVPTMEAVSMDEDFVINSFLFDPAKKEEIASNVSDISTKLDLINNYLTQANNVLTSFGLSSRSESIQDAVEKVRTIDNLKQAFDELESATENAVSKISGMLAGQISTDSLIGLSEEEKKKIEEMAIEFCISDQRDIQNNLTDVQKEKIIIALE